MKIESSLLFKCYIPDEVVGLILSYFTIDELMEVFRYKVNQWNDYLPNMRNYMYVESCTNQMGSLNKNNLILYNKEICNYLYKTRFKCNGNRVFIENVERKYIRLFNELTRLIKALNKTRHRTKRINYKPIKQYTYLKE